MALFFKTFRHSSLADSMGIPVFPLSKNELKHQAKYEDDEYSVSDNSAKDDLKALDRFARLDMNRKNRMSVFEAPLDFDNIDDRTEKRSNQTTRDDVSKSLRKSMNLPKPSFHRSASEVDEVKMVRQKRLGYLRHSMFVRFFR